MDTLDHLVLKESPATKVLLVSWVCLVKEVFQDQRVAREAEEILDCLAWKDQLENLVNEDLKVLLDHLVHLERLEALVIQVNPAHLERWVHREAWETEDPLDHRALKASLGLRVSRVCLASRVTEACLGTRELKGTLDLLAGLESLAQLVLLV
jgi:hypothetical protein